MSEPRAYDLASADHRRLLLLASSDHVRVFDGSGGPGRAFAVAALQAAWSDGMDAVDPWLPREGAPTTPLWDEEDFAADRRDPKAVARLKEWQVLHRHQGDAWAVDFWDFRKPRRLPPIRVVSVRREPRRHHARRRGARRISIHEPVRVRRVLLRAGTAGPGSPSDPDRIRED